MSDSVGDDQAQVSGQDEQPRRGPSFDEVAVETAKRFGVCIRPMVLERADTITGAISHIPVPCGNTMEAVCPACAKKAKALRLAQCREGWHLDHEPEIPCARPTFDQTGLMAYRADLIAECERVHAGEAGNLGEIPELLDDIAWVDKQLTALGMRGKTPAPEPVDASDDGTDPAPDSDSDSDRRDGEQDSGRARSTRRRPDVPELPRNPIQNRTLGREYAGKFKPSMMITLTLPTYGHVDHDDGTPIDPDSYDYDRAAWDAIWFARLFSRWIQNLRRVAGWNVQYFASVEPQRRGAPHAHIAIRGDIPHRIIRQVTQATYHQVWWPHPNEMLYHGARAPLWDREAKTFVDPDTRLPLQSWDAAMDSTWDYENPAHLVRFGTQVHSKGILGGTEEANRHIGYLCKYLTKSVSEVLEAKTPRQHAHYDRLHQALCRTPCSERCAVWLLYGIVPKGAKSRMQPGRCKARAHRRETLGLPGNRVLTSELWTGKTLGDHQADRMEFVRATLAAAGIDKPTPDPHRYTWSKLAPGTRIPSRAHLLMAAIAQRIAWRAEYDRAMLAAEPPPGPERSTAIRHS
ncbi:replication initiator [Nocardia vinacea]|uniref:replication initiator n=1 Tax=Nocardia vinacea TaxID=96468 RepID=UPI001FE1F2B0|nr:replication initiator [Nocardia vinacea]